MAQPTYIRRACSCCRSTELLGIAVSTPAGAVEVLACTNCDRMACPHCKNPVGPLFGRVGDRCEHCGGRIFE